MGYAAPATQTAVAKSGPLIGKTFVLTGRLAQLTRGEATARLQALGATVGENVTKKTGIGVVVGEDAEARRRAPKPSNGRMVNEAAFLDFLAQHEAGPVPSEA